MVERLHSLIARTRSQEKAARVERLSLRSSV
jgi:hypothetical protein